MNVKIPPLSKVPHNSVFGKCNNNNSLLLKACAAQYIVITNTILRLPTGNKTSWFPSRPKHWHFIAIIRKRDRRDARVTKAMCGADCWADQRLILYKLKLCILPTRRSQDWMSPSGRAVKLQKTALSAYETQPILGWREQGGTTGTAWRKTTSFSSASQWSVLNTQEGYLHQSKTYSPEEASWDEWQVVQWQGKWNPGLRWQPRLQALPWRSEGGVRTWVRWILASSQCSGTRQNLESWAEHFNNVLNRPASTNVKATARLPQVEPNWELENLAAEEEVRKAIKQLSCGKAPGPDAIPAEVCKSSGPVLTQRLAQLFQSMWHAEKVPQEYKGANIIHTYKRKGNHQSRDNHSPPPPFHCWKNLSSHTTQPSPWTSRTRSRAIKS